MDRIQSQHHVLCFMLAALYEWKCTVQVPQCILYLLKPQFLYFIERVKSVCFSFIFDAWNKSTWEEEQRQACDHLKTCNKHGDGCPSLCTAAPCLCPLILLSHLCLDHFWILRTGTFRATDLLHTLHSSLHSQLKMAPESILCPYRYQLSRHVCITYLLMLHNSAYKISCTCTCM